MAEIKTFICDIPGCGNSYTETIYGQGAKSFGKFTGITLNGTNAPIFCEGHRAMIADFIDSLDGKPRAIDIGKI